jgi:NTE family protein
MKFGLALGGGGARGSAHIGVIMELERLGLRPDLVTGTSIGGLVGALVAAGLDSSEMDDVFRRMEFGRIYSLPGRKPALINNTKLKKLMEETIGRVTFDELQIPLAMVTTDLVSREEVILDSGDVVSAVLATTAFPVVLPPVEREGRTLIDGGVLNNTPFDVARAMGTKDGEDDFFVLAVDLANSAPYGTEVPFPPGSNFLIKLLTHAQREPIYQAVSTMADILTTQNVNDHMEETPPDLMLRPDMGTIGLFDFHRLEEGIEAGRQAAKAEESILRKLVTDV